MWVAPSESFKMASADVLDAGTRESAIFVYSRLALAERGGGDRKRNLLFDT